MIYLKQSTASQEVLLGPFVDSTDGVTAETALSIANTDIKVFKAGATTLADKNSGGATHISAGNYYAVLDATDTDTVGSGALIVQVSGALAVRHDFVVLPANVYDSLIGGTDVLNADVTQFGGSNGTFSSGRPEVNTTHAAGTAWGSGAITAASLATGAITAAKFAAGAIDAAALAADAGAEIADAVWDEQVDGTTTGRQSIRLINSAAAGKASGLGTTTAVYRDLADTKDRISATVDADGNRTAITRDVT
mgnify:FL=1